MSSPAAPAFDLSTSSDPYALLSSGIVTVHRALVGSLETVIAAADAERLAIVVPQTVAAAGFLLGHHDIESAALFPTLRRHGKLRSTDVAFLDSCDAHHREIHRLCERLLAQANGPHPAIAELGRLARDTLSAFGTHILEEEAGLAVERLRTMIDAKGFAELEREIAKVRPQP